MTTPIFGMAMAENSYENVLEQENKFLYNGKELQEDLDLNWYDFGARFYDPAIGRFFTQDRFIEKYYDFTPYQYGANNPIKYIDVNGDSLWINYGDNQKVLYQNGNLYTVGNGGLIEYDGNDSFVASVFDNLNTLNHQENGQVLLNALSESSNSFSFLNASPSSKDAAAQFIPSENGGGQILTAGLLGDKPSGNKFQDVAHELFHGYQYDNGQDIYSVNNEVGAYLFSRSAGMNSKYGGSLEFGNNTMQGQKFQRAMSNLILGNSFNGRAYEDAVDNFHAGSTFNQTGLYNSAPNYK